jgi:hypothetical protein
MSAVEMTKIGRVDFFANVDGPWPNRCRDEFAVELDRLAGHLLVLMAAGKDRPAEDFSASEQFVIGVKDAAAWTLGVSSKAPFRGGVTVVSDRALGERVADAVLLIRLDTQVRYYAEGVRAWLLWLAGDGDGVRYLRS